MLASEGALRAVSQDEFNKSLLRSIRRRITGVFRQGKDQLLSLDEVRDVLKPTAESYRGMQSIKVSRITGSEGRYSDFTRSFLPKHAHSRARWVSLNVAAHQLKDVPSIRVYELGGVYFIRDGNHRVSVARHHGTEYIDAQVTGLDTYFAIEPGMDMKSLVAAVIEYERQRFVAKTHIHDVLPSFNPHFTAPGRYDALQSHIRAHGELTAKIGGRAMDDSETISSWYSLMYLPVVQAIREQRAMAKFPGRTEADLYVWIMCHWELLQETWGGAAPLRDAIRDFVKSRLKLSARAARMHPNSAVRTCTNGVPSAIRIS